VASVGLNLGVGATLGILAVPAIKNWCDTPCATFRPALHRSTCKHEITHSRTDIRMTTQIYGPGIRSLKNRPGHLRMQSLDQYGVHCTRPWALPRGLCSSREDSQHRWEARWYEKPALEVQVSILLESLSRWHLSCHHTQCFASAEIGCEAHKSHPASCHHHHWSNERQLTCHSWPGQNRVSVLLPHCTSHPLSTGNSQTAVQTTRTKSKSYSCPCKYCIRFGRMQEAQHGAPVLVSGMLSPLTLPCILSFFKAHFHFSRCPKSNTCKVLATLLRGQS